MNEEHLKNYFHFNESDLIANRGGGLSDVQLARLTTGKGISKTLRIILASILFGLSACLLFALFAILPQIQTPIERIIWPAFLIVFVLVTAALGFFFIRGVLGKPNTKLEKVEGAVSVTAVERSEGNGRRHTSFALQVGGERFWVTAILASYLTRGDVYTVYFVRDALNSDLQFTNIMSLERRP